ncbi:hypothetical protein KAI12_05240, partial [Candidatus Bathyarchaeota archaeon]|nr:hypothetical protein [Candidatus Bathyarchaeota archaeon]
MKKWHLYGLVLIVAILVFSTVFLGLMTVYNSDLTSQYVELSDDFAALEEAYDGLEARHDSLQSKYNSLLPDPSSGINESDSYKILHKLQDELQTEFDNYVAEYQEIRRAIDQRLLRAPAEPFITPFDPEVVSVVNEITGGYTNSSKPSDYWPNIKAMYDWVKNNIEYRADGLYPILPYDPADGIEHKSQMVQFPNETLSMRAGDCEDQAT